MDEVQNPTMDRTNQTPFILTCPDKQRLTAVNRRKSTNSHDYKRISFFERVFGSNQIPGETPRLYHVSIKLKVRVCVERMSLPGPLLCFGIEQRDFSLPVKVYADAIEF